MNADAARERMRPDPATLARLTEAVGRILRRPDYWAGYARALERAISTARANHADECDRPACRTCPALAIAGTAVQAHHRAVDQARHPR